MVNVVKTSCVEHWTCNQWSSWQLNYTSSWNKPLGGRKSFWTFGLRGTRRSMFVGFDGIMRFGRWPDAVNFGTFIRWRLAEDWYRISYKHPWPFQGWLTDRIRGVVGIRFWETPSDESTTTWPAPKSALSKAAHVWDAETGWADQLQIYGLWHKWHDETMHMGPVAPTRKQLEFCGMFAEIHRNPNG